MTYISKDELKQSARTLEKLLGLEKGSLVIVKNADGNQREYALETSDGRRIFTEHGLLGKDLYHLIEGCITAIGWVEDKKTPEEILASARPTSRLFRRIRKGKRLLKEQPEPIDICFQCGEAILDQYDLVRAHVLDENGFGRMNAPFHKRCRGEVMELVGFM